MKRLLMLLFGLLMLLPVEAKQNKIPEMYAHRGCWSKNDKGEFIIPENSIAAVAMARVMGYKGIECDVHYTKDKRMVILHDATLNRTARNAKDYSKLDKPIKLADLTFEELRRDYVLESTNPALRTPIPTLEELLTECKKQGIVPMLHSSIMESYHVAQKMFGDEWICFTGGVEHMKKVREFSNCTILLAINNGTAEENIARLRQIGGHCGISTMKYQLYTPEFCKALTDAGYEVQASIFPHNQTVLAQKNGITYQLTDYSFMPPKGKAPKYTYKVNMSMVGALMSSANKKNRRIPTEKLECAGQVIEITTHKGTSGEIEAKIGDKKYTFHTNGKEKIYIGRRLIDSEVMKFSINSNSKIHSGRLRSNIKRVKSMIYEM